MEHARAYRSGHRIRRARALLACDYAKASEAIGGVIAVVKRNVTTRSKRCTTRGGGPTRAQIPHSNCPPCRNASKLIAGNTAASVEPGDSAAPPSCVEFELAVAPPQPKPDSASGDSYAKRVTSEELEVARIDLVLRYTVAAIHRILNHHRR